MTQTVPKTPPSILVPVDFSAASREALLFAAQLATCSSLPVIVLHVIHDDVHRPDLYPRRNATEQILPIADIAEQRLQRFMSRLQEAHPDNTLLANAGMLLVNGLPATRIPEIARRIGAGLIIMGGSGRGKLSKLIAGSVSDSVIRHSPVPVTVVHANGSIHEHPAPGTTRDAGAVPYQVSESPG